MSKRILILALCITASIGLFTGCSQKDNKEQNVNENIFEGYDEDEIIHVTVPEYFDIKDILTEDDQYLIDSIQIKRNEDGTYDYAFTEATQNSVKYAIDKEIFDLLDKYTENFKYSTIICSKDRTIIEFYTDAEEYDDSIEFNEEEYGKSVEKFNIINGTKAEDIIYYVINETTGNVLFNSHPEHAKIDAKEAKTDEEKIVEEMLKDTLENSQNQETEETEESDVDDKLEEESEVIEDEDADDDETLEED